MVKRVLSFLLAVCLMAGLLVSGLPAANADAAGSCGENAVWSFDAKKGVLTISGTGAVTCPGDEWPWASVIDQIKTVEVKFGVTEISGGAFGGCENLHSVTLADSVQFLGDMVFGNCRSLRQVDLGSGMTTMEWGLFHDCSDLTSLVVPATVTYMEDPFDETVNMHNVWFLGDAPQNSNFHIQGAADLGTTVYYPANNSTWTEAVMNGDEDVTWLPYDPLSFEDTEYGDYFFESVLWTYNENITTGTSATKFSPSDACTRAQVVTFLWRSVGSPAPTSQENPFTDVEKGKYYYDAVLWAVGKGITTGATDTTFDPDGICNRAQVGTFLHRAAGKPAPESQNNPFADVAAGKYYYDAVLWAVEKGITNGVSSTKFCPGNDCIRGQIVTFLYRYTCPRVNEPFNW